MQYLLLDLNPNVRLILETQQIHAPEVFFNVCKMINQKPEVGKFLRFPRSSRNEENKIWKWIFI